METMLYFAEGGGADATTEAAMYPASKFTGVSPISATTTRIYFESPLNDVDSAGGAGDYIEVTHANTTASTILSFTTGKELIKGWIQFNGFVQPSNPGTGTAGTLDVAFNGQRVITLKTETELETSSPHSVRCPILIPPLTAVSASIDASATEAAMFATIVITGRVYNA